MFRKDLLMTVYAPPATPVHEHDLEDAARPDVPVAPTDPDEVEPSVHAYLTSVEATRQRQLDALPKTDRDPVAAAYRDTVERILAEVRTALRRAGEGLYGVCAGCGVAIPRERLELRPWATACASCATRER